MTEQNYSEIQTTFGKHQVKTRDYIITGAVSVLGLIIVWQRDPEFLPSFATILTCIIASPLIINQLTKSRLCWSNHELWLKKEPLKREKWRIRLDSIQTVKFIDEDSRFEIKTKTGIFDAGNFMTDAARPLIATIGSHLEDTETTERAHPFAPTDPRLETQQRYTRKFITGVVITLSLALLAHYLVTLDPKNAHMAPIAFLFVGAIGLIPIRHRFRLYKRSTVAAKLPKLADVNRDVELEIYEEFGEDSDAAARFYRHLWSHHPKYGWLLLPEQTQRRLLNKAKELPK